MMVEYEVQDELLMQLDLELCWRHRARRGLGLAQLFLLACDFVINSKRKGDQGTHTPAKTSCRFATSQTRGTPDFIGDFIIAIFMTIA